jgi:hypothetical protein
MTDEFAGVLLTAVGSLPPRCAPRGDLATRRRVERAVREPRAEIAAVFQEGGRMRSAGLTLRPRSLLPVCL